MRRWGSLGQRSHSICEPLGIVIAFEIPSGLNEALGLGEAAVANGRLGLGCVRRHGDLAVININVGAKRADSKKPPEITPTARVVSQAVV